MSRSSECIRSRSGREFPDKRRWRGFYNVIQRSHFKSRNVQKLEAVVKIYAALSEVAPLRDVAKTKLTDMLKHPFPKVIHIQVSSVGVTNFKQIQTSAADALYVHSAHEQVEQR